MGGNARSSPGPALRATSLSRRAGSLLEVQFTGRISTQLYLHSSLEKLGTHHLAHTLPIFVEKGGLSTLCCFPALRGLSAGANPCVVKGSLAGTITAATGAVQGAPTPGQTVPGPCPAPPRLPPTGDWSLFPSWLEESGGTARTPLPWGASSPHLQRGIPTGHGFCQAPQLLTAAAASTGAGR